MFMLNNPPPMRRVKRGPKDYVNDRKGTTLMKTPMTIGVGEEIEARVVHVKDVSNVFIHDCDDAEGWSSHLHSWNKEMERGEGLKMTSPKVGDYVAVSDYVDEEDCQRGRVIAVNRQKGEKTTFSVFLVDYGRVEVVPSVGVLWAWLAQDRGPHAIHVRPAEYEQLSLLSEKKQASVTKLLTELGEGWDWVTQDAPCVIKCLSKLPETDEHGLPIYLVTFHDMKTNKNLLTPFLESEPSMLDTGAGVRASVENIESGEISAKRQRTEAETDCKENVAC